MDRIKIREVDKDVYELSTHSINSMYVSGEQLRTLKKDIDEFFEEQLHTEDP